MRVHGNAKTNVYQRRLLIRRVRHQGWTQRQAAEALGVSVGWLVGEDASRDGGEEEIFRALARPGALELLEAFGRIPDARAREALVMLAREMAAGQAAV